MSRHPSIARGPEREELLVRITDCEREASYAIECLPGWAQAACWWTRAAECADLVGEPHRGAEFRERALRADRDWRQSAGVDLAPLAELAPALARWAQATRAGRRGSRLERAAAWEVQALEADRLGDATVADRARARAEALVLGPTHAADGEAA